MRKLKSIIITDLLTRHLDKLLGNRDRLNIPKRFKKMLKRYPRQKLFVYFKFCTYFQFHNKNETISTKYLYNVSDFQVSKKARSDGHIRGHPVKNEAARRVPIQSTKHLNIQEPPRNGKNLQRPMRKHYLQSFTVG